MSNIIEKLKERIAVEQSISLGNVKAYQECGATEGKLSSTGEVVAFSLVMDIIAELEKGSASMDTQKEQLEKAEAMLKIYKDAANTVVEGYEGDGMECMGIRDNVFYEECRKALIEHDAYECRKMENIFND